MRAGDGRRDRGGLRDGACRRARSTRCASAPGRPAAAARARCAWPVSASCARCTATWRRGRWPAGDPRGDPRRGEPRVSEPVVAVVGAGITGLACAAALAPAARGRWWSTGSRWSAACSAGTTPPDVGRRPGRPPRAGAALHLGETAIRWDGDDADGDRAGRACAGSQASALVIAAGSRPLGRAELGLTGPRPAGILPATVACHLSETGLLIGRRPAVIGGGDWAARALERLLHAGADTVEVIAPDGVLRPLPDSDARSRVAATAARWRSRACTAVSARAHRGRRADRLRRAGARARR